MNRQRSGIMEAMHQMLPQYRDWLICAGLGAAAFAVYLIIGRISTAPHEVLMPDWVPFLPWLAVPYLLQLVVSWFLLLAIHDRGLRRLCLIAVFAAFACSAAIWLLYPTIMHRPLVADAWWNVAYRRMIRIDRPTNIAPCAHILMPVIISWALAYERPGWLWWVIPFQLLGAVAIVATWQHRPLDLAIGIILALGCGLCVGLGRWGSARDIVMPVCRR